MSEANEQVQLEGKMAEFVSWIETISVLELRSAAMVTGTPAAGWLERIERLE